jgi:phospholipid/cholesterol/gamma-HCH transport system permease protein
MTASSQKARAERGYQIEHVDEGGGAIEVRIEGAVTFADAATFWREIQPRPDPPSGSAVRFDLSRATSLDGAAMALLVQTKWDLQGKGVSCELAGGRGAVKTLLELYEGEAKRNQRARQVPIGALDQIGRATVEVFVEIQLLLAFIGSMVLDAAGVIRRPRTANWHEIPALMNRTGADAVPIVVLINFLVGFVMAFQAAVQLKQFGANIYVADLVSLSLTREMGPLMTAIILCGRSGAAFAAEIGTMKVSEEIDALRTMGIGPLRFLVFPRLFALFLVAPVLTLLADLVGIIGGLLVGIVSLDLTITGYLNETRGALEVWDVAQGVIKGAVFAVTIGLISCQQGLATSGGAEGVGRRTTASVVSSLFALILIDAGFTMLFHFLHV